MERPGDVREARLLQGFHIFAAGHFGKDIEDAHAPTFLAGHRGQLLQSDEGRGVGADDGNVGHYQRPFSIAKFGKEQIGIGHDVYAPALGIEKLANPCGVLGVLFQNKNADLSKSFRRGWGAFHPSIIRFGSGPAF